MPRHRLPLRSIASRLALLLPLLLALLGGAALRPGPAAAATIVVRSGADAGGPCPGASCTLRQAIAVAASGDTITFAPAVTVVTLTSAELLVIRDLTIQGSGVGGVTIRRSAANGTPAFRIIDVTSGAHLTLRGLTIANGLSPNPGGGILANIGAGGVTLVDSVVRGNTSNLGGGIALYVVNGTGALTLTNSAVSDNTATDPQDSGSGGGIFAVVSGISSGAAGSVTLTDSTVSGNTAVGDQDNGGNGGGIYALAQGVNNGVANLPLTLTGSTISGNTAVGNQDNGGNGGGIFAIAVGGGGGSAIGNLPLTVTNSTVSGNAATGGGQFNASRGGGIYTSAASFFGTGSVPVALDGATFADNTTGGQGHQLYISGTSVTVARSAFALPASGPAGDFFFSNPFSSGTITSGGDNVSQRDLPGATGTDATGTDPLLGPLAANGGPTQTRLPLAGSPLLDRIPAGRCALPADQRGVARPQGAGCEPGAVEAAPALIKVRGDATYGDATATLTATLTLGGPGGAPLAWQPVAFTLGGQPVGSVTTDANGVATLPGVPLPPGTAAGTTPNAVCASFAGNGSYAATGPTCGPLVVGRRILTVKPVDQTVKLKQPNPTGCTLELAPGSAFLPGDGWASVNLTNLRCTTSRNYPASNASETVGKVYKLSATGVSSANYDLRFQQGTLTVVAP